MRLPILAALVFVSAACADRDKATAADADLARDLALANQLPANPQFQDTALSAAPAPTTATPAPAPVRRSTPQPARPVVQERRVAQTQVTPTPRPIEPEPVATETAPAPSRAKGFLSGTRFTLATKSPVCTTNLPGDKIVATLTAPLRGDNGAYLPQGTSVVLEVASVTPGDTPESAHISLRVRSILIADQPVGAEADVAVLSDLERREVPRNANSDRRKVVGGAVAGAIVGQIMGRDTKSTVIGAAAGAAAGAGVAAASRKYDACLPAGGTVSVTISQPIILSD